MAAAPAVVPREEDEVGDEGAGAAIAEDEDAESGVPASKSKCGWSNEDDDAKAASSSRASSVCANGDGNGLADHDEAPLPPELISVAVRGLGGSFWTP